MITSPSQTRLTEGLLRDIAEIPDDVDSGTVTSLSLIGESGQPKICHVGNSLTRFVNLRELDFSRNVITSLNGLETCIRLEKLTLYYNKISSVAEIDKLQRNTRLQVLDLRLNPLCRLIENYRCEVLTRIPWLISLDNRDVDDDEREELSLAVPSHQTTFEDQIEFEGIDDHSVEQHSDEDDSPSVELLEPLIKSAFNEGVKHALSSQIGAVNDEEDVSSSKEVVSKNENSKLITMLSESHQVLIQNNQKLLDDLADYKEREKLWESRFEELKNQFKETFAE
ncbi:hypothetical protein GEMRC1_012073 [Eukaryota sp. GEM-RC1]